MNMCQAEKGQFVIINSKTVLYHIVIGAGYLVIISSSGGGGVKLFLSRNRYRYAYPVWKSDPAAVIKSKIIVSCLGVFSFGQLKVKALLDSGSVRCIIMSNYLFERLNKKCRAIKSITGVKADLLPLLLSTPTAKHLGTTPFAGSS